MALPGGSSGFRSMARRSTLVLGIGGIRIDRRAKEVPSATARMEQRLAGIRVNFPSHAINVNFNQIRKGIEGLIPDVLRDFRTSYYAAGVARKIFEQSILFGSERHASAGPGDALRGGIQGQIRDGNFSGTKFTGTAQQGPETRKQLAKL